MGDLKKRLKGKLSSGQVGLLRRGYDIIGDIAVVEVPRELVKKKKMIAEAVMGTHHNVKAVYMEKSGRKGKLRLQKLEWLAGERRTLTTATENGVRLKVDVARVYFSPRISSERRRIWQQVKGSESVLVMFSGVGPYVVEIAKHTAAKIVYGVEVNRAGHELAVENAKLNKVGGKARFYCGDVKKVVPQLKQKFDRIIMPLPKGARDYLGLALRYSRKNAVIHYYDFLPEEEIPKTAVGRVKNAAKEEGKKIRVIKTVKCGQLAPRSYRVCVDFRVY